MTLTALRSPDDLVRSMTGALRWGILAIDRQGGQRTARINAAEASAEITARIKDRQRVETWLADWAAAFPAQSQPAGPSVVSLRQGAA